MRATVDIGDLATPQLSETQAGLLAWGDTVITDLSAEAVLAAAQHLEYELRALVAVLPRQGLDVLEGRRLERLEPVVPVHVRHDADDVVAAPDIVGEKIAHATRGARLL